MKNITAESLKTLKTARPFIAPFALLCVGIALVQITPAQAQRLDETVFENIVQQQLNTDSSLQDLNSGIESKAKSVKDIEERLNVYKDNLAKKQQESLTLKNQISVIEDRISVAKETVGKNKTELDILQLEVEVVQKQLEAAQKDIERNAQILGEIMKQLYIKDKKSPLEIALSSSTLSEFYAEAEYSSRIQQSLQETVDSVQKEKNLMQSKQEEMSNKKADIAKQTADIELQKGQLEGEQTFKDQLLGETKQSEEEFQKLVEQTRQQQAQLESEVAALQGTAQQKINAIRDQIRARLNDGDKANDTLTNDEQSILTGTSTFIWPITSRRITCGFHCPGYPFQNYIGAHSGMDVGTPLGSQVRAAGSGYIARVVFDPNSSKLAWVMIVHGDGLASLYLHLSGVNVRADQYVNQGDVIGRSGGLAGTPGSGLSTGAHLHFEVRLNGIPTDPAKYLP